MTGSLQKRIERLERIAGGDFETKVQAFSERMGIPAELTRAKTWGGTEPSPGKDFVTCINSGGSLPGRTMGTGPELASMDKYFQNSYFYMTKGAPIEIPIWPIDRLVFYARNPRKDDAAVDRRVIAIEVFACCTCMKKNWASPSSQPAQVTDRFTAGELRI